MADTGQSGEKIFDMLRIEEIGGLTMPIDETARELIRKYWQKAEESPLDLSNPDIRRQLKELLIKTLRDIATNLEDHPEMIDEMSAKD